MPVAKRTLLQDLAVGYSWYTEKGDGTVDVAQHIKMRAYGGLMPDNLRAALALTQACRYRGRGMVYCLFSDYVTPDYNHDDEDDAAVAGGILNQIPGLLYIPERWTPAKEVEWDRLNPGEQATRCWAPNGFISGEVPALPIQATVTAAKDKDKASLKLGSNHDAVAVVMVTDSVYVGPPTGMRRLCQAVSHVGLDGAGVRVTVTSHHQKNWGRFRKWRQPDMEHVAERLGELCDQRKDLYVGRDALDQMFQTARQQAMPIFARMEEKRVTTLMRKREEARVARLRSDAVRAAVQESKSFAEVEKLLDEADAEASKARAAGIQPTNKRFKNK